MKLEVVEMDKPASIMRRPYREPLQQHLSDPSVDRSSRASGALREAVDAAGAEIRDALLAYPTYQFITKQCAALCFQPSKALTFREVPLRPPAQSRYKAKL